MRRRDEEVADDVFFLEVRDSDHAAAAAVLRAERVDRDALDVAADGHGDDDLGVGDDVFDRKLAFERLDRGPARIADPLLDVERLVANHAEHPLLRREQIGEVGDRREQRVVLVLDLLPLESGERAQTHVDDRRSLHVGEAETRAEVRARVLDGLAAAHDRDDLIDVVECDAEAFEQVGALLRLAQVVRRPAAHDVFAVRDEMLEHRAQAEHLRLERRQRSGGMVGAVAASRADRHERQHVERKAGLQRSLLVELVEHDLRRRRTRELDHDPHPVAIRFVVERRNADDPFLLVRFDDRLDDARRRDLIRDLGDDDAEAAALFDDLGLAAQRDRAAPGLVGLTDRLAAHQDAAGRKVRTLHDIREPGIELVVGVFPTRVVDQVPDRIADLACVVRRDVGRHTDRDPRAAVDEQLR